MGKKPPSTNRPLGSPILPQITPFQDQKLYKEPDTVRWLSVSSPSACDVTQTRRQFLIYSNFVLVLLQEAENEYRFT